MCWLHYCFYSVASYPGPLERRAWYPAIVHASISEIVISCITSLYITSRLGCGAIQVGRDTSLTIQISLSANDFPEAVRSVRLPLEGVTAAAIRTVRGGRDTYLPWDYRQSTE